MGGIQKTQHKGAISYTVVNHADLPLACPPKETSLWNMHPRIYLTFDASNKVICPYCGTTYRLYKDGLKS